MNAVPYAMSVIDTCRPYMLSMQKSAQEIDTMSVPCLRPPAALLHGQPSPHYVNNSEAHLSMLNCWTIVDAPEHMHSSSPRNRCGELLDAHCLTWPMLIKVALQRFSHDLAAALLQRAKADMTNCVGTWSSSPVLLDISQAVHHLCAGRSIFYLLRSQTTLPPHMTVQQPFLGASWLA